MAAEPPPAASGLQVLGASLQSVGCLLTLLITVPICLVFCCLVLSAVSSSDGVTPTPSPIALGSQGLPTFSPGPPDHLTWTQTPEPPTAFPTITLLPSITPPPTYTLVVLNSRGGLSSDCACSSNLYNCSDFSTQVNAQACYQKCFSAGVGDIHELDNNDDRQACESLP